MLLLEYCPWHRSGPESIERVCVQGVFVEVRGNGQLGMMDMSMGKRMMRIYDTSGFDT